MMKKDSPDIQVFEDAFQHNVKRTKNAQLILRNVGIMLGIIAIATLISFGFRALNLRESSYIIIYMLSVLMVAYLTKGYLYGIIASALCVLVFNFFFTEPYYTLMAYSPEYPVTFIVMIIVSLITSTLTTRVKDESQRAETREKRIRVLYQNERNLLAVRNMQQAVDVASKDITQLFGLPVLVGVADLHGELTIWSMDNKDFLCSESESTACTEAFQSGNACGAGTMLFPQSRMYFQPINGLNGVLGVIGIAFENNQALTEGQKILLDTISAQVALAIERERLYEKQQRTKLEFERERLRGDLLSSFSHDLRTPLTGILGSATTVIENYEELSDDIRKDFLQGICADAEWLNHLVDNILSMTRFREEKITLKKEMEAVEELVAGAVSHIRKRTQEHDISISIPDELIMIPVEGTLIEQVLVNLLDNAVKHTPEKTKVHVSAEKGDDSIVFKISDNGPGIPDQELALVFNRFYTSVKAERGRRGFGLGLAICKAIVEAHGGEITAYNNPQGGATFRFSLPAKE